MDNAKWLHIVSVSGGKDSTATCLYLTELGIPHRRVFADTGWELPETYRYLDVLRERLGPIDVVRGPQQMEDLILHKGMFPSRPQRFCTERLKFRPIKAYLSAVAIQEDTDVINVIGVRAEESRSRALLPEREFDADMGCDVWRPIINWKLRDVIDIHKRHGLRPNPLYLRGFRRVGCAPCIMARKEEIALLANYAPAQIDRVRALESALSSKIGKDGRPPAFFQARTAQDDEDGNKEWPCVPIDTMVEWSQTSRGGRQLQLIQPNYGREGCMRWGLCDTAGE